MLYGIEEEESAIIETPISNRKGPNRSVKFTSSYKGILGVQSIIDADIVFLVTLDDRASKFSFSLK